MRQNGCSCAPSTKHTKCGCKCVTGRLSPLSLKGNHQISSIRILNFPLWLIILLDTKPQEPEAGCQYSAFSLLFTPLQLYFKSHCYHRGPTHDSGCARAASTHTSHSLSCHSLIFEYHNLRKFDREKLTYNYHYTCTTPCSRTHL